MWQQRCVSVAVSLDAGRRETTKHRWKQSLGLKKTPHQVMKIELWLTLHRSALIGSMLVNFGGELNMEILMTHSIGSDPTFSTQMPSAPRVMLTYICRVFCCLSFLTSHTNSGFSHEFFSFFLESEDAVMITTAATSYQKIMLDKVHQK